MNTIACYIVHTYYVYLRYPPNGLFIFDADATCDKAHITGVCSLLHLLINSWQYTSSFKKCLQEGDLLSKIVVSLKAYFNETDVCSVDSVEKVCRMQLANYYVWYLYNLSIRIKFQ